MQLCLVAENVIAGVLPKKEAKAEMAIDPMTMMLNIMERMRVDSERRDEQMRLDRENMRAEKERRDEQML